jgi:pimeloyl-ACP methyl ester carboxylesterase
MATGKIKISDEGGFYSAENTNAPVLIVLLHAYTDTPNVLQRAAEISREEYPDSDLYAPKLPLNMLSTSDPEKIAAGIFCYLDRLPEIRSYTDIIFVGHSMGAIFARKVWALAIGATADAEIIPANARPWSKNIKRIVMLAALNRGWTISSALGPQDRLNWTLGTVLGNFLRYGLRLEPLVFAFQRGAPFLTTLRLQCLAAAETKIQSPIIVQLLGTHDDFVAPTDNLDLATGQDFYYLEVEHADHKGIVKLEHDDEKMGAGKRFRAALKDDPDCLRKKSVAQEDVFDLFDEATDNQDTLSLPQRKLDVQHVVFVIHGIRDRGFWTRRIAREVKSRARVKGEQCRAVTSTYGYFPMGPFLLPWMRRSKVEWLLDQYVTAKSLYPGATFSYIGHSNGTYLLAKAMELCPAITFPRVVFGGSVVRCGYKWSDLIPKRVTAVLNYVATGDWVVAVFPNGLEQLQLEDLGGAGHLGFAEKPACPNVCNYHYAVGDHSASLDKSHWGEMADFVLNKSSALNFPTQPVQAPARSERVEWWGQRAKFVWIGLAILVFGIAGALLYASHAAEWVILFAIYLYLLRAFLTRA